MKVPFKKIMSTFFLAILLSCNIVGLHVFFHDHDHHSMHEDHDHSEHHENESDSSDTETECDLCKIASFFYNLDFNNNTQNVFTETIIVQQNISKKVYGYVKTFNHQFYLDHNRNKAPPYIS